MRTWLPVVFICITNIACAGGIRRSSLDERVRAADLIVVGTVLEIQENKPLYPIPPAAMASKIAVLRIEQTLKGSHDSETVAIGFDILDEKRRHEHEALVAANQQYIVFLRSLRRSIVKMHGENQSVPGEEFLETLSFKAPVNWRHGIYLIEDGKVWDPRYPSELVNLHKSHNADSIRTGEACFELGPIPPSSEFDRKIPLQEALSAIRSAIVATQEVVELGRVYVDGTLCPILIRHQRAGAAIVIRRPKRADCPVFVASRIEVTLAFGENGEPTQLKGPYTWPTESHVDPTGTFEELTWECPEVWQQKPDFVLRILVDGKLSRLFESKASLVEFLPPMHDDRCKACGLFDVSRISYGLPGFSTQREPEDVRCNRPPSFFYTLPAGCMVQPEEYHCNMCGIDW